MLKPAEESAGCALVLVRALREAGVPPSALALLPGEGEVGAALVRDPRVVRGIGRFLRRFSIDELPQLWCVVTGTMSLVGPRPLPDYHLRNFPHEFMELRRSVRPGVTGLWQITVRNGGGHGEQRSGDERQGVAARHAASPG